MNPKQSQNMQNPRQLGESDARRWTWMTGLLVVTCFLMWAALWNVRTWLADHYEASEQFGESVRMRPDKSGSWRLLAEQRELDNPAAAENAARMAVRLNPEDWKNWSTLGMVEYELGKPVQARSSAEKAATLDRGFQAHYELANLAFLLGEQALMQHQLRWAFRVAPANDVPALIQLALRASREMLDQYMDAIPTNHVDARSVATETLLRLGRTADAYRTWTKMKCDILSLPVCQRAGLLLVDNLANAALGFDQPEQPESAGLALTAWNRLVQQDALPAALVRVGHIPDGRLEKKWDVGTFSWRNLRTAVVTHPGVPGPVGGGAVRAAYSGQQPDSTSTFRILIPVQGGTTYRFEGWVKSDGTIHGAGLRYVVRTAGQVLMSVPFTPRSQWQRVSANFRTAVSNRLVWLEASYKRPSGSLPFTGAVNYADMTLETEPPANK